MKKSILLIIIPFILVNFTANALDSLEIAYNINKKPVIIIESIYSENKEYFARPIVFSNDDYQYDLGITQVYRAKDDSLIYEIPKYLKEKPCYQTVFLSNDGKSLVFIASNFNEIPEYELWCYKNGILKNKINLDSLIIRENDNDFILYNNCNIRIIEDDTFHDVCVGLNSFNDSARRNFKYDKSIDSTLIIADKYNTFLKNDTLYLISPELEVLTFSMNDFKLRSYNYLDNFSNIKNLVRNNQYKYEAHFIPDYSLLNSNNIIDPDCICSVIADSLNMKYEISTNDDFKYYDIYIKGFISKSGMISSVEYSNYPPLNYNEFDKIFENIQCIPKNIPDYAKKWNISLNCSFRNRIDSIAKLELIEYLISKEKKLKENAFKDTLNGEYIPKDLYEAMAILDKDLNDKSKNEVRSLSNAHQMIKFHMGAGMGIRNRWGLWHNSRLSIYFQNMGIYHPDEMSGVILEAYWHYLKDSIFLIPNFNFDKFIMNENIFISLETDLKIDSSSIWMNFLVVKTDTNGVKMLYPAFEKSDYQDYVQFDDDTTFSNFQRISYDNDSKDFLLNLIEEFALMNPHGPRIILDSLLFLEDFIANDNNSSKLDSFNLLVSKVETNKHLSIRYYFIFHSVGKEELDSLDNTFCNLNKLIRLENPDYFSSEDDKPHINIINEYLLNKHVSKLYVIRYYPMIKFDFKEYKQVKE